MYDKRLAAKFIAKQLSEGELEELIAGNDLAATIVEEVPRVGTKEGYLLNIADDEDRSVADACENRADEMGLTKKSRAVWKFQRGFGGGAMLMGADDGQRTDKPLNMDRIKSFNWLTPMSKRQLRVKTYYEDAANPKFGQPETYSLFPIAGEVSYTKQPVIHESRLIIMQGIEISPERTFKNFGWGDSVLRRCEEVLRDVGAAFDGTSLLLGDAGQRLFKMKGLAAALGSNNDAMVTKRAQMIQMSRSICRGVLLDSEESMTVEGFSGTGIDAILDRLMIRLSAAARMPVTVLFGQSPAGMNATGESDFQGWYDVVKGEQTDVWLPALNRFFQVLFATKDGPTGGVEPEKWSISFEQLEQLTDEELAALRYQQAQTDDIYIANGTITPPETRQSRFGGTEYSTETKLDEASYNRFQKAQAAIASADPNAPIEPGGGRALPAGGKPAPKGLPGRGAAPAPAAGPVPAK